METSTRLVLRCADAAHRLQRLACNVSKFPAHENPWSARPSRGSRALSGLHDVRWCGRPPRLGARWCLPGRPRRRRASLRFAHVPRRAHIAAVDVELHIRLLAPNECCGQSVSLGGVRRLRESVGTPVSAQTPCSVSGFRFLSLLSACVVPAGHLAILVAVEHDQGERRRFWAPGGAASRTCTTPEANQAGRNREAWRVALSSAEGSGTICPWPRP
jgi:hypothetical protein